MNTKRIVSATAAAGAIVLLASGCVARDAAGTNASGEGTDTLTVNSSDSECAVSAAEATSGNLTFDVSNDSAQITEFYLLADDGLRIIGEVENIAPGANRQLTVVAQPGDYFTLCKPGMVGEGVGRAAFTVTGDKVAVDADLEQVNEEAVTAYAAFVKDQVEQLVPTVEEFTQAYVDGDDETARDMFPNVRKYYERIEPVAEALGDLDPKIDYREVDAVAEGLDWTGFHRIEKDLWVPAKDALNSDDETPAWQDWEPSEEAERAEWANLLNSDIGELNEYVHSEDFIADLSDGGIGDISNGAIALLDEVATGKITGEEDWWSGTDLWDFQANVEGSKNAYLIVRDYAESIDADLVAEIDEGYASIEETLAEYGSLEGGFVNYSELTDEDRKKFTDEINALAEPLSNLTVTVLS